MFRPQAMHRLPSKRAARPVRADGRLSKRCSNPWIGFRFQRDASPFKGLARPTPTGPRIAEFSQRGTSRAMEQTPAIWIKDPLAILADGAERGVVVSQGKVVELVPAGR